MLAIGGCGGPERAAGREASPRPAADAAQAYSAVPESRGGRDRVGQPAPAWGPMQWLLSDPLSLSDLRGRVVLIRFWTDTCPFCRATAPALAELDADYRERGVSVIGMYHPKPRGAEPTRQHVAEVVEGWGWRFPVALDLDWSVLDAFWLADADREYTSVSFVLDRQGVIRYVHPGPEFHPDGPASHDQCRRDYAEVREVLEALLAEPVSEPESELVPR
ncbi:MAG: TlpA disulfide reductase family protein [Nannocystaceae bacterium]